MKDEKLVTGLAVGSVPVQWYCMYSSGIMEKQLPFATELLCAETAADNITMILYVVIPLPFMLWVFSGRMEDIVNGYGRLYMIRNCSRRKILFREAGKMGAEVILLQSFAWAVYQSFSPEEWLRLDALTQMRVMTMYTLTAAAVVLLQFLLELLMGQTAAQIAVLVYCTVSLFVYDLARSAVAQGILRVLFFPNLGFAMRNGALTDAAGCLFWGSLTEILIIGAVFILSSLKIVNKRDIM